MFTCMYIDDIVCNHLDCTLWVHIEQLSQPKYDKDSTTNDISKYCGYLDLGLNSGSSQMDKWCRDDDCSVGLCLPHQLNKEFTAFFLILTQLNETLSRQNFIDVMINNLFTAKATSFDYKVMSLFVMYMIDITSPLDQVYPLIWSYINGDFLFDESYHFENERLYGSQVHNRKYCLKNLTSPICQNTRETSKSILNQGKDLIMKFIKTARQPFAHSNDNNDFILIPLCKFVAGIVIEPLQMCDRFKPAKLTPLYTNCYTFNGDLPNPLHNSKVGPKAGLTFVLDFDHLMPPNLEYQSVEMILHDPG
jgi:hypothetical protein